MKALAWVLALACVPLALAQAGWVEGTVTQLDAEQGRITIRAADGRQPLTAALPPGGGVQVRGSAGSVKDEGRTSGAAVAADVAGLDQARTSAVAVLRNLAIGQRVRIRTDGTDRPVLRDIEIVQGR